MSDYSFSSLNNCRVKLKESQKPFPISVCHTRKESEQGHQIIIEIYCNIDKSGRDFSATLLALLRLSTTLLALLISLLLYYSINIFAALSN